MDNNDEIKKEEVEVVIEKEEPKKEAKKEAKKEECKCNTKVLDNWLFFCFDILLLIFVLGIAIFIVDMRENLSELNQKADRIEQQYVVQDDVEEEVEVVEGEAETETTEETTSEETTTETAETAETAVESTETTETVE